MGCVQSYLHSLVHVPPVRCSHEPFEEATVRIAFGPYISFSPNLPVAPFRDPDAVFGMPGFENGVVAVLTPQILEWVATLSRREAYWREIANPWSSHVSANGWVLILHNRPANEVPHISGHSGPLIPPLSVRIDGDASPSAQSPTGIATSH